MYQLKKWVRGYFGFSQQETNGFIALSSLFFIILITLTFFTSNTSNYSETQKKADLAQLETWVQELEKQNIQPKKKQFYSYASRKPKSSKQNYKSYTERKIELKEFNPNTASQDELESLGFPSYLASRLIKYRNAGGKFKKKGDLKKLYGLKDELYESLEPFIVFPEKYTITELAVKKDSANIETRTFEREKFEIHPFDLTNADTSQLKQVRGIGSKLSARIVAYRDKLGGFHSLEQLKEVWGLKPEVITELKKYVSIPSAPSIHKIKINEIDFEGLRQHPYISYKQAKFIINYRTQHGKYESLADLVKIKMLEQELIQKLSPYLSFE